MSRNRSLERHIRQIYSQASKELTEKVDSFFAKFDELDKKKLDLVKAGKLSEAEYKTWRKNKLLVGNDYKALRDNVTDRMLNANKIAASYINGEVAGSYTKGYNRVGRDAEHAIGGYSFSMINEAAVKRLATDKKTLLPYKFVDGRKDTRWNTKKVNSAILQGIIQGEPSSKIAKRLMNVTEMNKESAVRNARTALTSASNHGRQDAMKQLQDDGVIVEKEWFASVGDGRTREAHLELHHVCVPIDEPFENSIGQIMFPGDPDADPANVYNCRCSIATKIIGFKKRNEPDDEQEIDSDNNSKPSYSTLDLTEPKRPRRSDFEDEDEYYAAREEYRADKNVYQEKFDEVVEKGMSFKRFETKDDVVAWAKGNNVQIDDGVLERIDLRSFNEATTALDEMFERFPEVKSHIMEDFDGSTFQTGFSIGLDDTGLLSANGGFNFNPRLFENYEYGLRDGLGGQTDGYFVRGDGTFSSLVRHEYGHNVQEYIESKMAMKYHYYVDDWRKNFSTFDEYKKSKAAYTAEKRAYDSELRSLAGLAGSSEYSNTNTLELFAEGFAEWASGGKSEFGKAFGEFFGRWYH